MKKYLNILLIPMFIFTTSCEKDEEPEPDDCAGVAGGDNICACTDQDAINYDATATYDDGSCEYDETAPSVSLISPASGSVLSGYVTVEVFASDNIGIKQVVLYRSVPNYIDSWVEIGVKEGESSTTYNFTWNTNNISNTNYKLKATAVDDRDNESSTDERNVVVTNYVNVTFNNNLHTEMLYSFDDNEGIFDALSSTTIQVVKNQGQVLFQGIAGMSCGDAPAYEGYITVATSNITENLDVDASYFFLYLRNNSGYTMNDIVVNKDLVPEDGCYDVTIPSDNVAYQIGYFVAGTNSNIYTYTDADATIYWAVDPITLPFLTNQSFTLSLGSGRMAVDYSMGARPDNSKALELLDAPIKRGGIIMTETITPN